jgi:pimeloyl-ACP methyl ester carboxylesterase
MGCVLSLRLALEYPHRVGRLVLVALTGGVDVVGLGGEDWRDWYRLERADCPPWFVDDRSDFTGRLASVKAPVRLIFGDHDPLSPVAVGEFLRDRMTNARLTVLPGATHSMTEEAPDAVAAVIRDHLDK